MHSPALHAARLDAIDRALGAMGERAYGVCARCGTLIDLDRLRDAPDTRVCGKCARAASAESVEGSALLVRVR